MDVRPRSGRALAPRQMPLSHQSTVERTRLAVSRPGRHAAAGRHRRLDGDPDGQHDRGRSRRLFSGIAIATVGRGAGILLPLVLIPVTLGYLGRDLYGLWMAVTALTAMVAFADLGLGHGLMTRLAPCYAHGDVDRARRYTSTAYLALTVMALVVCSVIWLLSGVIPWSAVFNTAGAVSASDARAVALVCLTAFIVNIPLSLVTRVQYAYQQVGQSNIWQAAGSMSSLPLVLGAVHARFSPVAVVAASVVGPVLANVANSIWLYVWRMPEIRPRPGSVDRALAKDLSQLGGLFFAGTIVMSLALNADTLIVAHTLGLASVTAYAVPARIFGQLSGFASLVNLPLWSANGDALARGQVAWIRRTTRRMAVLSGLTALLPSVILVLVGDRLFAAWLGTSMGGDRWLLVGLGAWLVALAATSPLLMVQNAAGVVLPQLLGCIAYLVLSVVAKWYGARCCGITVVPYASFLSFTVTVLPAAVYGYWRVLAVAGVAAPAPAVPDSKEPGRPRPAEDQAGRPLVTWTSQQRGESA
jgi:O-antigen/teichoic acid export membrane protein